MNTIVATCGSKELVSSLAFGLLATSSRFNDALDEVTTIFSNAGGAGMTPRGFVDSCRKAYNFTVPDTRSGALTTLISMFSSSRSTSAHFPSHSLLDYALAVERVTTSKKDTVKLFGAFTLEEADEYIKFITLNGMFILGCSIGIISHHLDQKCLSSYLPSPGL
ncbi:hypothetical protein JOM56_011030 [Amanita muscaria]